MSEVNGNILDFCKKKDKQLNGIMENLGVTEENIEQCFHGVPSYSYADKMQRIEFTYQMMNIPVPNLSIEDYPDFPKKD